VLVEPSQSACIAFLKGSEHSMAWSSLVPSCACTEACCMAAPSLCALRLESLSCGPLGGSCERNKARQWPDLACVLQKSAQEICHEHHQLCRRKDVGSSCCGCDSLHAHWAPSHRLGNARCRRHLPVFADLGRRLVAMYLEGLVCNCQVDRVVTPVAIAGAAMETTTG